MRKFPRRALAPTVLALAAALALSACNRDDTDATAVAEPAPAPAPEEPAAPTSAPAGGSLVLAGEGNDRYLTDNAGRAIYALEGDDTGTRCVGDCLIAWPVVGGGAPVSGVPEVEGALIATTTRAEGTVQVTYAGHPLYYFAEDTGPGITAGRDVRDTWGSWYLIRPSGELLSAGADTDLNATATDVSNEIDVDRDSEETEPPVLD